MRKKLLFSVTLILLVCWTLPALATTAGSNTPAPAKTVKVNINTATAGQLAELPGIGPKTAERIVTWRSEHGKFQKLEDLMAVKGIGEKKFARLKDSICLE